MFPFPRTTVFLERGPGPKPELAFRNFNALGFAMVVLAQGTRRGRDL